MKKLALIVAFGVLSSASIASAQAYPYTYNSYGYSTSCYLTQTLSVGSTDQTSGGEVSVLQRMLVARGLLQTQNATGYFGTQTTTAVKSFQRQNGISVNGVVGSQTRQALNAQGCSYNYTPTYPSYPTYPTYPSYPPYYPYGAQTLSITSLTPTNVTVGSTVTIYGSGLDAGSVVHVGNTSVNANGYGNSVSFIVPQFTTSGSQQVYVTNTRGTSNTLTLYVTSGSVCGYYSNCYCSYPYNYGYNCNTGSISASYLNPTQGAVGQNVTVYGSGFSTSGNTIHFGNGIISNVNSPDGYSVSFYVPSQLVGFGSQSVQVGNYPVSVTNMQGQTSNSLSFYVTSTGSSSMTPTISSVNGPTSLSVGQQGTWSLVVNGYNTAYPYLTVSVRFGDEGYSGYQYASSQTAVQNQQTLTFTHTYSVSGSYTVTFTVTDQNGLSNTATASVTVSGSNTQQPTLTSISPTSGRVGQQVTLMGTGFIANGNTVRFGSGGQLNLTSSGTTILYTIPTYTSPCDLVGSGYFCGAPAQAVTPGVYPINVSNGSGTSNILYFTVTP